MILGDTALYSTTATKGYIWEYKQATVSRGLSYNYYYTPARVNKPTLLFVHGYPSTSVDWAGVVAVLEPEGYGVLVPDMLGYGGTDKPTEPALYVANSGIVRDLLDLLDAEGVKKAVAIGHDWGSFFTSRLANSHAERFLGFAFVTMGYTAPYPDASLEEKVKEASEKLGYSVFGYFPLLGYQEKLIEEHMDSFMDFTFSEDEWVLRYHLCPPGAGQAWLEADTRCARLSSPVATPQWFATRQKLLASGMTPPACYYKVQSSGLAQADEKAAAVPREAYYILKPVFFAACTKDGPTPPPVGDESLKTYARGPVTRREYDTGHWIMLTHYEQLGKDLSVWLKELPASTE